MKSRLFKILAVSMVISSCSSDGVVVGENSSAITIVEAGARITNEGDARPAGEIDAITMVNVRIAMPLGIPPAGMVTVAVEDVSSAESDALIISSVRLPTEQLAMQSNEVSLFMPLPLDGSLSIVATVHIDMDENDAHSAGDWISPQLITVGSGADSKVIANMVQI